MKNVFLVLTILGMGCSGGDNVTVTTPDGAKYFNVQTIRSEHIPAEISNCGIADICEPTYGIEQVTVSGEMDGKQLDLELMISDANLSEVLSITVHEPVAIEGGAAAVATLDKKHLCEGQDCKNYQLTLVDTNNLWSITFNNTALADPDLAFENYENGQAPVPLVLNGTIQYELKIPTTIPVAL